MNAPERAAVMTDIVAELLPITSIRPSASAAQTLRRARYSAEAMLALAANIAQVGVMQPILVRPIAPQGSDDGVKAFEIVAGERRWAASDRAGLAHVPAIIRDLTDAEALELQLSENIQREDMHPLEEAEGFHELMKAKGITADQLGDIIGKSRSYVYARVKLRDLCPEARDALQAGTLDASKALAIARLPTEKLQKQGLKIADNTEYYSFRRFFDALRTKLMVGLDGAPFALNDESYFYMQKVPGRRGEEECVVIPSCLKCPHYSGNDPELRAHLDDDDADVCTSKPCFESKVRQFWQRRRAAAIEAGKTVIGGDEAKKIMPSSHGDPRGYVDVDRECDGFEFPEPEPAATGDDDADDKALAAWQQRAEEWNSPTIRQALGDQLPDTILVEDPHHNGLLVELAPKKETAKALRKAGVKLDSWRWRDEDARAGDSAEDDDEPQLDAAALAAQCAKEVLARTIELQTRQRLFAAIAEKWKGPLKRPDLDRIIETMGDGGFYDEEAQALAAAFGSDNPDPRKMKDDALLKYIVLLPVVSEVAPTAIHSKPGALLELAQRFKIDAKKIRAAVTAELKPKPAPKADAPAAKAKKATKK